MNEIPTIAIKIIRIIGVFLGMYLFYSYLSSFAEERAIGGLTPERMKDCVEVLAFAFLLMFPWKMIKSPILWWVLFIIFCGTFLKAMSMCLLAETWARLHGGRGAGILSTLMGLVAIVHMIIFWTRRPRMKTNER